MTNSLCYHFQRQVSEKPDETAITNADGSVSFTWREYDTQMRKVAAGLARLGVEHGDVVAIMLTNRPEFHVVDAACMHLGAIAFSVYNTSAPEQIDYLLGNSQPKVVVTEAQFVSRINSSTATHMVVIDDASIDAPAEVLDLDGLIAAPKADFDFESAWQAVDIDDVLTLIYTSGTTGNPKGVELTHSNLLYQLDVIAGVIGDLTDGRVISYLPDAHLINRWIGQYAPMYFGITVTDCDNPKILFDVLGQVHPTFFVAVPMLWYKIVGKVRATIDEETGVKGNLVRWAVDLGRKKAEAAAAEQPLPIVQKIQYAFADKVVLCKLREKLGMDQLTAAVSGAAPIDRSALDFMASLGIDVLEAWGMSETSAVTTVCPAAKPKVGTVGKAIPGTELRLAEDGEVLVRGGGVMRGYHRDPEKTVQTLDSDGWIHTGDVGVIDNEGYLSIVDRKKELIINNGGKNMSPSKIEGVLKGASPLVGSVAAIGDQRPHVAALITLDPDAAAAFAKNADLGNLDPVAMSSNSEVLAAIGKAVEDANTKLSRVEHIRTWEVLPTFWAPGGDELTPTMKLRRAQIARKYSDEIENLYVKK